MAVSQGVEWNGSANVEVTHQALKDFYLKFNAARANDDKIAEVLERYKGNHHKMLRNLHHLYKAVPVVIHLETAQEGGSSASSSKAAPAEAQEARVSAPQSLVAAVAGVAAAAATGAAAAATAASSAGSGVVAAVSAPRSSSSSAAPPSASHGGKQESAAERLARLEAEVRENKAAVAAAETQLAALQPNVVELEARWEEISVISNDALRQRERVLKQAAELRKQVDEKDASIASLRVSTEQVELEVMQSEEAHRSLQVGFQERLQREVLENERQLQSELASLRAADERRERQFKELTAQKTRLERLEAAGKASAECGSVGNALSDDVREAMCQAHYTIAKAFGDVSLEAPLMRVFDEPMLKFTAFLFKQPQFRRVFFGATAVIWAFGMLRAIGAYLL
eukprot:TRINITY_DN28021_c0_g1_i1.p1 TRINITY_DN28021_c0_g1~~TRINITY_DN28021_c0_g1_i1.p1  ORF type:complete len:398 (-),score=131.81 TRINITY_DN28021_c0_g1_i1:47-1240(-)